MSEWQKLKLSDFVGLGKDQFKPDQNADFNYIGLEHIEQESLRLNSIGHSSEITSNKFFFKTDDILFGKLRPYFRKVVKAKLDGVCSTDIWVVRAKKNFSQDFVFYFMANWEFIDTANAGEGGSRMPRADWNFLKETEWIVPNYEEQKAIASVLSSLDDKIDLLHRQNKTLETIAETLFRQWFVEEGADFKEGYLADVAIHVKESIKASDLKSESKYIGLEHIDQRNIALKQYGFGSEVSSNKYAFQKHDILFGKLRPYFHKVCFAPFSGICSTDILVIRPIKSELFAFCLFAFFQDEVVEYANLSSGGTRMPRTDWTTLKNYPIAIPDSYSIERFNNAVSSSLKKISSNLEQIANLETLRDTLLPKLMSGEVRVDP